MSEVAVETTEKTNVMEETSVSEATTKQMTRGDYFKAEHLVQTGKSETLPDGRNIKEVQNGLVDLQKQQENAQAEKDKRWAHQANKNSEQKSGDQFLKEKVEVSGFTNGASSARPVSEIPKSNEDDWEEPENDLPNDLPGRTHFLKHTAPITRLEDVAKLDLAALDAIPGIGKVTAAAVLAYGKEPSSE